MMLISIKSGVLLFFVTLLIPNNAKRFDKNSLGFSIDNEDHFLLSRKTYKSCSSIRSQLENGWVQMRSNRKFARFLCGRGYRLSVGNGYSSCICGKWNRNIPACTSGTCPKFQTDSRQQMIYSNDNKVINVRCDSLGYYLKVKVENQTQNNNQLSTVNGNNSKLYLYCVSDVWKTDSQTNYRPERRLMIPLTSDSQYSTCETFDQDNNDNYKCDYEESLCNWFQDINDDFDWTRAQYSTPSHLDRTGPNFDHTYGANNSGWYLYIESSYPRVAGDKARIYSPVFNKNLTNVKNACFRFYYHMYGSAIGALRVFVMECLQTSSELIPRVELIGEQGKEWKMAEIELHSCQNCSQLSPFQIILEGEVGNGHQGDIAIDDFHLQLGQSCSGSNKTMMIEIESDLRKNMHNETLSSTQDKQDVTFSIDANKIANLSIVDNSTLTSSAARVGEAEAEGSGAESGVGVEATMATTTTTAATLTLTEKSQIIQSAFNLPISTQSNITSKNSTFKMRIPLIDHIKSYFKPKNSSSIAKVSFPTINILINTTTAAAAKSKTETTTPAVATTTTTATTTATITTTTTTTTATATATTIITTIAPKSTHQISDNDTTSIFNVSSTANVASLKIHQKSSSSSSWIVVLCLVSILAFVIIALSIAAISYDSSLNPLKFGSRNKLREFVSASFIRRNVDRSTLSSDDSELLVMEDSFSGYINECFVDDQEPIYPADSESHQSCLVYLR